MRNAANATVIVATFLLSSALPAAAGAQSTGLEDMVGARAGQAEGELQRRGYVNTGGSKGDDRSYTNWWNAARRQGAHVRRCSRGDRAHAVGAARATTGRTRRALRW